VCVCVCLCVCLRVRPCLCACACAYACVCAHASSDACGRVRGWPRAPRGPRGRCRRGWTHTCLATAVHTQSCGPGQHRLRACRPPPPPGHALAQQTPDNVDGTTDWRPIRCTHIQRERERERERERDEHGQRPPYVSPSGWPCARQLCVCVCVCCLPWIALEQARVPALEGRKRVVHVAGQHHAAHLCSVQTHPCLGQQPAFFTHTPAHRDQSRPNTRKHMHLCTRTLSHAHMLAWAGLRVAVNTLALLDVGQLLPQPLGGRRGRGSDILSAW
jgi:hypothetical protein